MKKLLTITLCLLFSLSANELIAGNGNECCKPKADKQIKSPIQKTRSLSPFFMGFQEDHNSIAMAFYQEGPATISISDFQGRTFAVQSTRMEKGRVRESIDVSGLSAGIYFVKVSQGRAQQSRVLIIQ